MSKELIFGNVHLDVSKWPGHDDYTDGAIEEELYTRLVGGESELDMIKNDKRYTVLYHLSRERENILLWYPFKGNERVLEVGAGCGAVTGILCQKCGEVISVELSLARSKINAVRHAKEKNLRIQVQNIMSMEGKHDFDIVTLIGVLEYANLFTGTENPFVDLLKHMKGMLKPDGHLLIAIENRFGVKYFLGAREDHHWKLNEGLYGYPNHGVQTFSVAELTEIIKEAGFKQDTFFSVWPDYKFPTQVKKMDQIEGPIYRDEAMNFGEYVIQTASPRRVMNELLTAGLGNELGNSFFVDVSDVHTELPSDVLMNTNRNERFAFTSIFYQKEKIIKQPVGRKSQAMEMAKTGANLLKNRLCNASVLIPERTDNGLRIEWLSGKTLFSYMCDHGNEISTIWNRYVHLFDKMIFLDDLAKQERPMFGNLDFGEEILVCPAPIDLNFDNIMVNDDKWTVFDTEWVFAEPVPLRYILWRSVFLCDEKRGYRNQILWDYLKLNRKETKLFQEMERRFNNYVYGDDSPYEYVKRYQVESGTEEIQERLTRLQSQCNEQAAQLESCQAEIKMAWEQFSIRESQLDEKRREICKLHEELTSKTSELAQTKDYVSRVNKLLSVRIRKKLKTI